MEASTLRQITDQSDPEQAPDILLEEVNKAIDRLKLKKTPGIDNITAEEIKAATEGTGLHVAHSLCNRIWQEETFPSEWKQAVIVPILSLIHISEPTRRTPISYA